MMSSPFAVTRKAPRGLRPSHSTYRRATHNRCLTGSWSRRRQGLRKHCGGVPVRFIFAHAAPRQRRSRRCSTAIALARLATIQALILSGLAEDLESELRNINRRSARPDHRDRQDSLTVVASVGRCIRQGSESRQAGRGWHEPGTRGAASDPDIRRAWALRGPPRRAPRNRSGFFVAAPTYGAG